MTYGPKTGLYIVKPPPLKVTVPFSVTLAFDTGFINESLGSLHHQLAWNYPYLNAFVYASVDGTVLTTTGRSPGITDVASTEVGEAPTVMTAQALLRPAPALAVP